MNQTNQITVDLNQSVYEKINYITTFPEIINQSLNYTVVYDTVEAEDFAPFVDCALEYWKCFVCNDLNLEFVVVDADLGTSGVLAQAGCTFVSNGQCVGGQIEFNRVAYTNNNVDFQFWCNVAIHEIGHILGILDTRFPISSTSAPAPDQGYTGVNTNNAWQAVGGIGPVYFSEENVSLSEAEDGICACDRHFSEDLSPNLLMQPYSTDNIVGLAEMTNFQLQAMVDENGYQVHNAQYLPPWGITAEAQQVQGGAVAPYTFNYNVCANDAPQSVYINYRHFIQFNANLLQTNGSLDDHWLVRPATAFTSGILFSAVLSGRWYQFNLPSLAYGQREQAIVSLDKLDANGNIISTGNEVKINFNGVDCTNNNRKPLAYAPMTNIQNLPAGMSIDDDGCLTGAPEESGIFNITADVGTLGSTTFQMTVPTECVEADIIQPTVEIINNQLVITSNNPYDTRIEVIGGSVGGLIAFNLGSGGSAAYNIWENTDPNTPLCFKATCI